MLNTQQIETGPALARSARDQGIDNSAARADRYSPGWSDRAYSAVSSMCEVGAMNTARLGEDIRQRAYDRGLTTPSDERAWGQVFAKARRTGLLKRAGYAKAASSHLSEKPMWIAGGVT